MGDECIYFIYGQSFLPIYRDNFLLFGTTRMYLFVFILNCMYLLKNQTIRAES